MNKKQLLEQLERVQAENSGLTLVNYRAVRYEDGFQYSKTENGSTNTCTSAGMALAMIQSFNGTCGVWYDAGLFYVETSYHTEDLYEAYKMAVKYHQKSIYAWLTDSYLTIGK